MPPGAPPPPQVPGPPRGKSPFFGGGITGWRILLTLIPFLILLTVFFLVIVIGRPYVVDGSSMMPTLQDGDRVFVVPYRGNTTPDRGDVIVIEDVTGSPDLLIKRVVAIAGDRITIGDGQVVVNDELVYRSTGQRELSPRTSLVPDGHIFVMGDNESHSFDSRSFGPVSMKKVVGKAMFIFWPLSDLKRL